MTILSKVCTSFQLSQWIGKLFKFHALTNGRLSSETTLSVIPCLAKIPSIFMMVNDARVEKRISTSMQESGHLSISPSYHLSICPPGHLAICPSANLSICLCLSGYLLSICLSAGHLSSVHLSICPTVHQTIRPSGHLAICPYVHMSI